MFDDIFRSTFGIGINDNVDPVVEAENDPQLEVEDPDLDMSAKTEFDLGVDVEQTWKNIWPWG